MLPAFKPGDHVLTFNWSLPKIDNVVVFRVKNTLFIKRVKRVKDSLIYVSGDNKQESSQVGPVAANQAIGKVILKY